MAGNEALYNANDDEEETESTQSNSLMRKKSAQPRRQVKPKVSAEWSDSEIFNLITCVEVLPLLWNAKDEKYRNKTERQTAWRNMSEIDFDSKFTDTELNAKWSNMRIQFRSYFAKSQKTKSSPGTQDAVKWKFYDAMGFIGRAEQDQTPTTNSNVDPQDEITTSSNEQISTPVKAQSTKRRRLSQSATGTSTCAATIAAEGMKNAVTQLKQQCPKDDEFDTFGKYIASELRCLGDAQVARRVRFKVARCLMDSIDVENQLSS